MSADTPLEEEEPRKGRSNAILTYETVAALDAGIKVLDTKVDSLRRDIAAIGVDHNDHEVRIRALELTQTQFIAASTSRQGTVAGLWGGALGLIAVVVSVLAYLQQP